MLMVHDIMVQMAYFDLKRICRYCLAVRTNDIPSNSNLDFEVTVQGHTTMSASMLMRHTADACDSLYSNVISTTGAR